MMQYKAVFELLQKLHLQIYAANSAKLENEKSFLDEIKNIFHSF